MKLFEHLEAAAGPHGTGIKALQDIPAGTPLFSIRGNPGPEPEKYSIQLDAELHVHPEDHLWRLVNHSCSPNCLIDFSNWTFAALRGIKRGEELNFNYLTTEFDMAAPFRCGCASAGCCGEIRGYRTLAPARQHELAQHCSPYILRHLFETAPLAAPAGAGLKSGERRPAVYVLIPYAREDGRLDGKDYDNPGYRAEVKAWFEALGLPWRWVPVTLENAAGTIEKLKEYGRHGSILAFNLCDGSEADGMPGLSVVRGLEQAGLPFTGASSGFFSITTSKAEMKALLLREKVPTAPFTLLSGAGDVPRLSAAVYPALIKPDVSAASVGISLKSLVRGETEAIGYARRHFGGKAGAPALLAEKFVDGPEFTVLVTADAAAPQGALVYPAAERVFNPALPRHERFLSYDRYWEEYREESRPPEGKLIEYAPASRDLQPRLADLARRAFFAVKGCGYARVDIRMEESTGELFVLEVNSNPGLSAGMDCSIGKILRLAGVPAGRLIEAIMRDAFRRAARGEARA